jgi:hypothetical protein
MLHSIVSVCSVLAQSRYLVDPAFLNYIEYLQYWHRPEYLPFIAHPFALYFLGLLRLAPFRSALLQPAYISELHDQSYWHWRNGRYNRFIDAEQRREAKQVQAVAAAQGAAAAKEEGQLILDASPSAATPMDDKSAVLR